MKKRKRRFPYGLLFLLMAVFLVAVAYWASSTTPQKVHRKTWVAPVHVVEPIMPEASQQPDPLSLPSPLPALNETPQYPVLAQNIAPVLPSPDDIPIVGKPRIAIVIDDMGINAGPSERAIALPAAVTLSFLPYGARVVELTGKAKAAGHELLLHVPMEPLGNEKPGPGALLIAQTPEDLRGNLEKALGSFAGYDGINNHMGSRFTAHRESMETVLDVLREKNLFFLDSYTSGKSVGADVARSKSVPTESRDVFLDDTVSLSAINAQLAQTERIARRKGYAIAIGHPHASTLTALEHWLPEAEHQGFEIVPVRELVR